MRRHIEHLKSQHPSVRSRAAVLAATGITAVVALIWVTTLPIRFGSSVAVDQNTAAGTANTLSAFGDAITPNLQGAQDSYKAVETGVKGFQVAPNPDSNTQPVRETGTDSSMYDGSTGTGMNNSADRVRAGNEAAASGY